jgi:drug/metabolite transporter (DMT)-like permease
MIGGYSVSGRGPRWARIIAAIIGLASVAVTFAAPKPDPDLSVTTAHGAWFATLAASLGVCLALASSIPMLRPETRLDVEAQPTDVAVRSDLTSSS